MADTATEQKNLVTTNIIEPRKFKVIFVNDDKTPMDFVIEVLVNIFHHNEEVSQNLTLKIHNDVFAVVGVYPFEIAEQKGIETTAIARAAGHPLTVKIESE
jgi:ATP-dependent Clp protease adaptor protein ClpS